MLSRVQVLLVGLAWAGALVQASSLRGETPKRSLEVSGQCRRKTGVPEEFRAILDQWDVVNPNSDLGAALECGSVRTIQEVDWVSDPTGICGSSFEFSAEMGSCCGGILTENGRVIDASIELKDSRPLNRVAFKIEVIEETRDCCASCSCYGDPHCTSFDSEAHDNVRSFVACDTAAVLNDGTCTNRLDTSENARKRCLGLVDGYQPNGNGRCVWLPDGDFYDKSKDGGPCQPNESIEMHVIGREVNEIPASTSSVGIASQVVNKGRFDLFVEVGERGITRKVIIRMNMKDPAENRELVLDVKSDCAHLQSNGAMMAEDEGDAITAIFSTEDFIVTRRLKAQTTPAGSSLDLFWVVASKKTSDMMTFNCAGATSPASGSDGVASFREELKSLTVDQKTSLGIPSTSDVSELYKSKPGIAGNSAASSQESSESLSTRLPKETIINARFLVSKVGIHTNGDSGFCFNGYFEEYREWYNGQTSPYEQCAIQPNLSYEDREILSSLEICQKFLVDNECDTFTDDIDANKDRSQPNLRHFNRYKRILDNCIKAYCGTIEGVTPQSREICYAKFYDFGSQTALAEHPEDGSAGIAEMQQENCDESVTLTYVTNEGVTTIPWDGTSNEIVFEGEAVPLQVILNQHDCAGVCGTRPRLKLSGSMTTDCGALDDTEYVCYKREEACDKLATECPS